MKCIYSILLRAVKDFTRNLFLCFFREQIQEFLNVKQRCIFSKEYVYLPALKDLERWTLNFCKSQHSIIMEVFSVI